MDNLSTNQKIALGVGAAATVAGALIAAYWLAKTGKDRQLDEDKAEAKPRIDKPKKKEAEPVVDDKLDRAAELRAEGNKAFTNKDYEGAIRCYTEALALSDLNAHLLYSNRSAAYLFKGEKFYESAIADAQRCLDLKPDWSKAYFRMGKALMAAGKYDEAFKQFYRGTLVDKNSDELKLLLEQCTRTLGICEKDSRAHVEKEMVKMYSREQCENLCNTILHVSYEAIRSIIDSAIKDNKLPTLLEDSTLDKLQKEHPIELYRVLAESFVELENYEEALSYSEKAHKIAPKDPQVLLLLVTSMLRSGGSLETYTQAFEYIREAVREAPDNVQIVHTYASLLLQQSTVGVPLPDTVRNLLQELKKGLDNSHTNHLLIADCGMRLWFKLLEEHTSELIAEEQKNMQNQTPPDEAYIFGLTQGAFSKVCLEPFFQRALCQVVFSNPGLETVLAPFRSAFTSLKPGATFTQLSPFIHAVSLQCYRNNYSWPITPEDQKRLTALLESAQSKISSNQPETLITDGVLDSELYHHLSIISLFQPLHTISGLSAVVSHVNKSNMHEWFIEIIKKTLWNYEEEQRLKETIFPVTPMPENDPLLEYYNKFIPVWDSAGLAAGRLTTVTVAQELKWLFKNYSPKGFDGTVRTLVAGCGSGGEVYQNSTFYKNMEITAMDISLDRVAYAIRQHQDLGVPNINFQLGDVTQMAVPEQKFDMVIANGVIHHLNDPTRGWAALAACLRPGGLMRMSLYSGRFIDLLGKTRKYLNSTQQFTPPLFTTESPLPQVKRPPTLDDIRTARNLILGCEEKDLEDLKELVTSPQFYALNEFTELVFHPKVLGFTFEVIGEVLHKMGLKLVGFEFPGLPQEVYLKYVVEHPDDTDLINIKYLESFNKKHPDAFKNFTHTINFLAEKI